jgi:hypothetical protein
MSNDTENKTTDLSPPTEAEAKLWFESLSPGDQKLVKNQQMIAKLTNKQQDEEPNWARLGDSEFLKERLRLYGF